MHLGITHDLLKDGERCGELAVPALGANAPHDSVSGLKHAIADGFRAVGSKTAHDTLSRAYPPLGEPQMLNLLVDLDNGIAGVRRVEGDLVQFALHTFGGPKEFGRRGFMHVRSANIDDQLLAVGLRRGLRSEEPVGLSVGDFLGRSAGETARASGLL